MFTFNTDYTDFFGVNVKNGVLKSAASGCPEDTDLLVAPDTAAHSA